MAEFLTQDEIDALLSICDDDDNVVYSDGEIKKSFFNFFNEETKYILSEILNKNSLEITQSTIKEFEEFDSAITYIENNFYISINKEKKFNCSIIFPDKYKDLLVKNFIGIDEINEEDAELNDGIFEITENIIGSFITSINANKVLYSVNEKLHFNYDRKDQKIINDKDLRNKYILNNNLTNILKIKVNDELFHIFFIIDNNIFNEINNSSGYFNIDSVFKNRVSDCKNYSYYDFKKPNLIDINYYKSFSTFFYEVTKKIEQKLKDNIFINEKVSAKLYSIEQMTSEEFMLSTPQISCFNILKSENLKTKLITEINPSINNKIITSLLGLDTKDYNKKYYDNFYNEEGIESLNKIKNQIFEEYYNTIILNSLNENLKEIFSNISFENTKTIYDGNFLFNEEGIEKELSICSVIEIEIGDESAFLSFCFNINDILPFLKELSNYYINPQKSNKIDVIEYKTEDVKIIKKVKIKNKDLKENTKINLTNNKIIEVLTLDKLFYYKDYYVNNVQINIGNNILENICLQKDYIELNQKINEPFEISIDKNIICLGDVVLIEGEFGFKIKQINEDFIDVIDNIENEYYVIKKDNKRYLSLKNIILFEVNKENVLVSLDI